MPASHLLAFLLPCCLAPAPLPLPCCRVDTEAEPANPWDAQAPQPSPTAWPQAATPSAQRSFKPSWSKAGKQ